MGKRNGDLYECDRSNCKEYAFVARTVREDGKEKNTTTGKTQERRISVGGGCPEGWTQQGNLWLCPKCSKSFDEWMDGKK